MHSIFQANPASMSTCHIPQTRLHFVTIQDSSIINPGKRAMYTRLFSLVIALVTVLVVLRPLHAQATSSGTVDSSTVTSTHPLSAGLSHTCAILVSSDVVCWGENADGQLGDGSTTRHNTPVRVRGLEEGVIAIGAGGDFTCALVEAGTVRCWGSNAEGQLGDGSGADSHSPVMVAGLMGAVTAIAVGGSHACALTESGGVFCWGHNNAGQVGGSESRYYSAHALPELSGGVIAIAAGWSHTCALTESKKVL